MDCFASIAPGLEEALADELADIGVRGRVEPGGVRFKGNVTGLYAVHLHSRLAGRVTVEVCRVRAKTLDGLGQGVRKAAWKKYIWPGQPFEVKSTLRGSKLRHGSSVQKKVQHAIADSLRGPRLPGPRPPREAASVIVRIIDDHAILSINASGELLHRRGWRKATAKAPLRENLAASCLRLADWNPGEALVDPMCGAGTFAIEAAGIAMGHAPGGRRSYGFERWPCFEAAPWKKALSAAKKSRPLDDSNATILGADRDEGAIKASRSNAQRANVDRRLSFRQIAFAELMPPGDRGLLILNPPYGNRVGKNSDAGRIFKGIGDVLKANWQGWGLAILVPAPKLLGALAMDLEEQASFKNGGLNVGLYTGEVR